MNIIIDDRERAVIPHFNAYEFPPDVTFSVSRITTGDYSILYENKILFIIERKTWKDLASSIKDGRKNNVENLLKLRNETGCIILYLIEGNPLPNPNAIFCRIPYKNLRAHLDHLSFRDNIHITYSKDEKNTVERIAEIIKNYRSFAGSAGSVSMGGASKSVGGNSLLKEKKIVTQESITYKIWQCIPGVTEKTSCLFAGRHISDLILGKITKDEIYALKYDNGYIIGKRADKIWNSTRLVNTPLFVKMLTQINGITKKTAEIILSAISFEKILLGEVTAGEIANIEKSPSKRRVGIKVAGEIIHHFKKSSLS